MLQGNFNYLNLIDNDENCYKIKRIFNKENQLSLVQILDSKDKIYKCLFYRDGKHVSNICVYNVETGKEIKNITYRADGETISSVREYNNETGNLSCVSFYKEDGQSVSSMVEYDDNGLEAQFSLFCDDGEVITQCL